MIKKHLDNHYRVKKLYSSYLINTDDNNRAIAEVNNFLQEKLFLDIDLNQSGDYLYITRDSKVKNITIDQVRKMQKFLSTTSVITGKKLGVINAADEMNLNAANACLKILEEPSDSSYMFLITENASNLIHTIRSRCTKINHFYYRNEDPIINIEFIRILLKNTKINEKINFIEKFATKDRNLWADFIKSMDLLLARLVKKSIGQEVKLSEIEMDLFNQLKEKSPLYLHKKYQDVKNIIDNTNQYDLDLRNNVILIIDKIKS